MQEVTFHTAKDNLLQFSSSRINIQIEWSKPQDSHKALTNNVL